MSLAMTLRRACARLSPDLLVCLAACANGLIGRMVDDLRAPSPSLMLGLSPFELLAAALAARALAMAQDEREAGATARLGLAHALAALAMLAPSAVGAWAVLLAFSLWRMAFVRGSARLGFALFAALAVAEAWAALGFKFFGAPLLAFDAALAARSLELIGVATRTDGNVVETASGHGIVVLVACATLHRMPLALVTALALAAPASARRCLNVCLAVAAGYAALNLVRLTLMGYSPAHYAFMHDGAGASLYEAAQTTMVFLLAGRSQTIAPAPAPAFASAQEGGS